MATKSREIRLVSRPQGEPAPQNFALAEVELGEPKEGEVRVRNLYFSVDPYMRGRMNEGKSYVAPFEVGKAMEGGAVGRVVASGDAKVPVGALVSSMYGWREAYIAPASQVRALDESLGPPSAFLGLLGVTGLTAWAGLFKIGALQPEETVFISGGAGAVGSAACQMAKLRRARVIASAGSEEKLRMLRDVVGVDYAFSYRDGDPLEQLQKAAPDGLHLYFDNTAGPQLEAAIASLRNYGRVAMCGAIAGYNQPIPGPRNLPLAIGKRLRLQGFIVSDYLNEFPAFFEEVGPAYRAKKLKGLETVVEGIEAAQAAFIGLLRSGDSHTGKVVIHLPESA